MLCGLLGTSGCFKKVGVVGNLGQDLLAIAFFINVNTNASI